MDKKVEVFELFFRVNNTDSITKYRFKYQDNAVQKCNELNEGLRLRGYTDSRYVVAKVTREYLDLEGD